MYLNNFVLRAQTSARNTIGEYAYDIIAYGKSISWANFLLNRAKIWESKMKNDPYLYFWGKKVYGTTGTYNVCCCIYLTKTFKTLSPKLETNLSFVNIYSKSNPI